MNKQTEAKVRAGAALLLSLFLTGIWFLIVYEKIPFIYDINDDVAMRNVAAGVITGEPDAHLLHIKYLLGLLISGLYGVIPGYDWYGLVMIGIVLFAFAMILYRGLAAEKGLLWKVAYSGIALLLFTCLGLQHVVAFQWTTTAAIAGAAGIFLFYTSETEMRFQQILEEGISVFLILLALAVRDDVFLMVLPVAGLCFWWKYGSLRREETGKWKLRLRHWRVPVSLAAGVILILGAEAFAYRDPAWKEFRSYNVDREAIMDFYDLQNYEEDSEFYDSLGITQEEAENIQRYSLYLVEDLYSENMAKLAERSQELYLQQHSFRERILSAMSGIYKHLGKETYHLTNLLGLCIITMTLGFCYGKNHRQLYLAVSALVFWAAYWLYLGYRNRILERVGFAMYLLIFLTMLAVWYRSAFLEAEAEKKEKLLAGRLLTAGSCAVLVLLAGMTWKTVEDNNISRSNYNLQFLDMNRYMEEHSENVYFMTTFSIETYTDIFSIRRDFEFSNLLSLGGWHTFSPLENGKASRLGITDPKRDIAEKENVYVISLENINLRYMDRYYESLYGSGYHGRKLVETLDYGAQIFEVYDFDAE